MKRVSELTKKDKYNASFIKKYLEMISGFCPPQIQKKDLTLKFAWKFMKKIFNDYVKLKKEMMER